MPLLSEDLWNGKRAGKKGGAAGSTSSSDVITGGTIVHWTDRWKGVALAASSVLCWILSLDGLATCFTEICTQQSLLEVNAPYGLNVQRLWGRIFSTSKEDKETKSAGQKFCERRIVGNVIDLEGQIHYKSSCDWGVQTIEWKREFLLLLHSCKHLDWTILQQIDPKQTSTLHSEHF